MPFSRRDFLSGVLLTGTATAIGTYFTTNGARSPGTTLRFLAGADSTGGRDALVAAWQSAMPSIKIEAPPIGPGSASGSTLDQSEALREAARSGDADILALDIIDIPSFQQQGLIQPIERPPGAFLDKTLVPCRLGVLNADPVFWAAPFSSDVGMLFVRGRPASTPVNDAGLSLRSILTTVSPDQAGQLVGQLQPSSRDSAEAFVVNILEHAISGNGSVLTVDGVPSSELVVWQGALAPLRDAVGQGRVVLSTDESQTTETFKNDRLRYMRNWPAEFRSLQQNRDLDALSGQVQLNRLTDGVLGGQCLAVSSACREVSAAQEFINFMASAPAQTLLASYGVVPAALAPYNDDNLTAVVPYLGKVRGAIESARLRPLHPNYACFSKSIVDNLASFPTTGEGLTSKFIDDALQCLE